MENNYNKNIKKMQYDVEKKVDKIYERKELQFKLL